MTNGSEGSKSGLWAWGVSSTLARGWNAFIYDGPGQQNMLFDRGHPFRPDWEAVLTPIVDALGVRDDVDGSALFAYGCSQAGYWVTRALAFEHRFVAAVVDPGVMDVAASWLSNIPPSLVAVLKAGKKDEFNVTMALAAMEYNLQEVIGQVKTPLLITDPDEESFWPGQSKEMYEQLTGEREIVHYSREDGANWHCEPMARLEVELTMLDYFHDRLSKRQTIHSASL